MAAKQMLIDAAHPEETRVTVIDGSRLEEYDVEVSSRRQLKGNIYLAKVTRVEPSLQAAFVDYGGNRHGFLAYNEIHPDYYQIPVADREALIAEQEAQSRDEDAADEEDVEPAGESVDEDDELERPRPRIVSRGYKIQEVIKRRQIMLIQVVKEERGNKGAALTTYLSLAGRYCVLMPNTSRGGGISRKITSVTDRKRLKKILAELQVPAGMAVIVRTAGAGRNKAEIKRDYEYLIRLWSNIRELTLSSIAPALVYEEGNLIKRSIRDLYERDIQEILVQGDAEYKTSKEFMKLFIPSHAKRVKHYQDTDTPLFQRYKIEDQLDAMHYPQVTLKSGGYLIIQPTEALVSIDVNSGRSTRERHIEETALKTNLEAADEIARQLRLRDLAGLIVVDFIDMMNSRYQAQVERRLKDATKSDRARIQIGRISPFGLMEMSRQRLRPSILETAFSVCPHCAGTGSMRTTESLSLSVLRRIEQEAATDPSADLELTVPAPVAMYLLNTKRRMLHAIEDRHGVSVSITGDEELLGANFHIDRIKAVAAPATETVAAESEAPVESEASDAEVAGASDGEDGGKKRRRRPRRRKRPEEDRDIAPEQAAADEQMPQAAEDELESAAGDDVEEGDAADDATRKRRRRGKRGGRRRPKSVAVGEEVSALSETSQEPAADEAAATDESADSPEGEAASPDVALVAPEPHAADEQAAETAQGDQETGEGEAIAAFEGGDTEATPGADGYEESPLGQASEAPIAEEPAEEPPHAWDADVAASAAGPSAATGESAEQPWPSVAEGEREDDAAVPSDSDAGTVEEPAVAEAGAEHEMAEPQDGDPSDQVDQADDDFAPASESRFADETSGPPEYHRDDYPENGEHGDVSGEEDVSDEKVEEARRTQIIDVDGDNSDEPRRGWWQRLVK